jgi:ABC-type glycerol-3-phosphate transport system substrate-binding protein
MRKIPRPGLEGAVMNKKIKQKLTSIKNYVKDHKSQVALAVLLLIAAVVYWWVFHPNHNQDQFGGPDDSQISPAAAAILDSWHGTMPSPSAIFQRPAGNVNWQQMTQAQRQQMFQQRMAMMEAFSMAFAHASPLQQQTLIDQMKQGFGRMGGGFGGPGGPGGGPGGPGGGGPGGGGPGGGRGGPRGTPNPQQAARRVANSILSGNPQMSAARNAMRIAGAGSRG